MHSNRWRNAVFAALLAVFLVSAGCTGTEKLITGQQTLTLEVQLINNTDTRFESAFFNVVQVSLRPTDPDADEALEAGGGFGVVQFTLGVTYRDTEPRTTSVSLNEGVYRVTSLILGSIQYRDLDPPTSTATCQEYVSLWNLFSPNPQVFTFTDFGEDIFVTVEPGGENRLTLVVDGAALEEAFLNSWTCKAFPLCPAGAAWCLVTINSSMFVAQGLEFIDFQ